MKQSLNTIAGAHQLMTSKIAALEAKSGDLEKKNEYLCQENAKLQETVEKLSARLEEKFEKFNETAISDIVHSVENRIVALEKHHDNLQTEIIATKTSMDQSSAQVVAFTGELEKLKKSNVHIHYKNGLARR